MSAMRFVVYHCDGCKSDVTRTVGGRNGQYPRATKTIKSLCASSGKVETLTKVRELPRKRR